MRPVGRCRAAAWVLVSSMLGCGVDTDAEAPYLDPPTETGACASTEDLLRGVSTFVSEGHYEPIRRIVEAKLQPTPDNEYPDPSWRSVVHALLGLIQQLGLEQTAIVATLAADNEIKDQLGPLISVVLQFVDGRLDGTPRYAPIDAAAFFVDRCDAQHLLSSIEGVLRLESPSAGKPWAVALLEAGTPLLNNPTLRPFLTSFEEGAEQGRGAIVSVLRQIMALLADEDFSIRRVQTLLDSAVYPLADDALERDIDRLVELLAEATDPAAGVLPPLQEAMRCGMRYGEPRDELLGFAFDLVAAPEVGLERVLDGVGVLQLDVVVSQLELLADVVRVLRVDEDVQYQIRALLILLLSRPEVEDVVPVLIDVFEQEILTELLVAVVEVLGGCGREG